MRLTTALVLILFSGSDRYIVYSNTLKKELDVF
jgi:hypothetical protein